MSIYARVSTADQTCENQLAEIHRYVAARGWIAEQGTSTMASPVQRSAGLRSDSLVADARRRRFDVLVVWRLDRLGRNLKHLVTLLEELQALGIAFVSLAEGIDATTLPASYRCTFSLLSPSSSATNCRAGPSRACQSEGARPAARTTAASNHG